MTIYHHYHRIHPRMRGVRSAHASFPSGSLSPAQVLAAYGFTKGQFAGAAPVRIGIGSLGGGVVQQDIDNTVAAWGMTPPNVHVRTVGGATGDPASDQDSNVENMLDLLIVSHTWWWLTGQPADVTITFGPNASGGMELVTQDLMSVVDVASWSWGSAASGWDPAERASLARAFASAVTTLGITFCAASGDNSIDDGTAAPSADYPCSDVNVWAVGGTRLFVNPDGSRASEIAWGDGNAGDEGGGGGFDPTVSEPIWQRGIVSGTGRGVPDTSANADPVSGWQISANGSWTVVGGTSASSPFTAALIAAARGVARNAALGIPPKSPYTQSVYAAAKTACNDITQGSNGDPATLGWDPATGLGSPNGSHFIDAIVSWVAGNTSAPSPVGPVTLQQAIAWAAQGINAGHALQRRSDAIANATKGLTKNWPK